MLEGIHLNSVHYMNMVRKLKLHKILFPLKLQKQRSTFYLLHIQTSLSLFVMNGHLYADQRKHCNSKSITGDLFQIGNTAVTWKSQKAAFMCGCVYVFGFVYRRSWIHGSCMCNSGSSLEDVRTKFWSRNLTVTTNPDSNLQYQWPRILNFMESQKT